MEANKKKILVVDDEQDLCEILKFNLKQRGIRQIQPTLVKKLCRWILPLTIFCCLM